MYPTEVKVRIKLKLPLYFVKYYVMKMYVGVEV